MGVSSNAWARAGKAVRYQIPEGLDPRQFLPSRLEHRGDDFVHLVGTVVRKQRAGKVDHKGLVRLDASVLRRVMSQRTQAAVVRAAVEGGLLECAGHRAGEYARGYRLAAKWRTRPLRWVSVTDPRLIERVHKENARLEQLRQDKLLPVHRAFERDQRELLSFESQAWALADALPDPAVRSQVRTLLRKIQEGGPGSRGSTGRWYSPVTQLKRLGFRPLLRLAGEPLGGFDLRCAQPALLAVLLSPEVTHFIQCVAAYSSSTSLLFARSSAVAGASPGLFPARNRFGVLDLAYVLDLSAGAPRCGPDLAAFRDLVLSGDLYRFLLDRCRVDGVDLRDPLREGRSESTMVKVFLLQDVLAKRGFYPSAFDDMFRRAFPSVRRAVQWINSSLSPSDGWPPGKVHGKLIRVLQRLESAFVLETVCPPLVDRIPLVPLHDCLFTRRSYIAIVEEAFHDAFDRCGVTLQLKRDVPVEQVAMN